MQETYFLYSTNSVQIQSSSNIDECPPENILHPSKTIYWMSEESLPQILIFDLTQMKTRPPICRGFGLYCQHISEQKPKIIEVFISKNKKPFISLGKFENDYNTQLQVYTTDEILFTDVTYIKLEIKETFGGYSTYITNFYLYEHLPEVDNSSKIIHSREMNLPYSGNSQREIILSESDVSGVGKGGNIKSSSTLDEHHTNRSDNTNNMNNKHQRHNNNNDDDDGNIHIISEDDRKEIFTSGDHHNYNYNYNYTNTINTNNGEHNINKYLITNTETNHLLHSSDNTNINHNNNNMNIMNTKIKDEDMVLLTEGKNLENSTKEYIDTLDTRINNLESGLTNLKSKFNFITNKYDTMFNYNQTQPQLTYNHLLSECNKMIDNKIQHYLRTAPQVQAYQQQESLNTSGMSNNERDVKERKLKFEEMLNRKIEEKFNVFTSELKERIFNSMLKPAMEHLNKHLERDLKEIRKQIKEVEIHNQKTKRRYSYRNEGNTNRNNDINNNNNNNNKQDKHSNRNKQFRKSRHYHNYKEEDEHELIIQTSNESRQSQHHHHHNTQRPPHHHHHHNKK